MHGHQTEGPENFCRILCHLKFDLVELVIHYDTNRNIHKYMSGDFDCCYRSSFSHLCGERNTPCALPFAPASLILSPRSIVVRASARGAGGRGSIPDCVTKDVKNWRFALLSLALGINELGIRLGGSESV